MQLTLYVHLLPLPCSPDCSPDCPPDCPCQCRQSVEELWEKVVERDAFNKAFLTVWENAGLDAMLGPGGVRAKQHYVLEY